MAGLCRVRKQAKLESGKTQSDKESPRYEVSEKIFRFDESATHESTLLVLNVSIVS